MLIIWWHEWLAWLSTLPADFIFLLALPFGVAALGLAQEAQRRRRRR